MSSADKNFFINFLKGFLMGVCDIIPGISGGTIALITGIYERLVAGIKKVTSKEIFSLLIMFFRPSKYKYIPRNLQKFDILFLFSVGIGIIIAIVLVSGVIEIFLENYYLYTISFFIGLIIASSVLIYDRISPKKGAHLIIIGFIAGLSLLFIIPVSPKINLAYVFFSGFVAINAMVLPGISGAYILLILGTYSHMINVLHNLRENFSDFIVFIAGAFLGLMAVSRIIVYFLRRWHSKTLFFLLGVVLGALSIPIKTIVPEVEAINHLLAAIILVLLGIFIVVGLKIVELKTKKSRVKIR